ncbi:hypothetical protein HanIR_Chr10g0501511 [Helianthus annuus]|nr:hypothetical protein HanIR_Chr10g0501511 [Helianthus annuus]
MSFVTEIKYKRMVFLQQKRYHFITCCFQLHKYKCMNNVCNCRKNRYGEEICFPTDTLSFQV